MKITRTNKDEALKYLENHKEQFPYAMITRLSSVVLSRVTFPFDPSEVIEARFFSNDHELRFFDDGNGLEAALLEKEGTDVVIEKSAVLLPNFGKKLFSRQYIDYDDDGQAYVRTVCLCGWEG